MMTTEKLKKATFKYIESEIYGLQETLREIDILRYELLHGNNIDLDSPQPGRNSVRAITDETETKATALIENKKLSRLEKISSAILKIYDSLIDEKQELEEFKRKAEELYKYTHINAKKSVEEKERLEEQNKRYREALEEIANKKMTYADMFGAIIIAKQALEESK